MNWYSGCLRIVSREIRELRDLFVTSRNQDGSRNSQWRQQMTNCDPIIELADLREDNERLRNRINELQDEVIRLRALLHVSLERAMYEGEG